MKWWSRRRTREKRFLGEIAQ